MNNSWLYETTLNGKLVTLAPLKRELYLVRKIISKDGH